MLGIFDSILVVINYYVRLLLIKMTQDVLLFDIRTTFERGSLSFQEEFLLREDVKQLVVDSIQLGRQLDYLKLFRVYSEFVHNSEPFLLAKANYNTIIRDRLSLQNEHNKENKQRLIYTQQVVLDKKESLVKAETRLREIDRSSSPIVYEKQERIVERSRKNVSEAEELVTKHVFVFPREEELQTCKKRLDVFNESLRDIEGLVREKICRSSQSPMSGNSGTGSISRTPGTPIGILNTQQDAELETNRPRSNSPVYPPLSTIVLANMPSAGSFPSPNVSPQNVGSQSMDSSFRFPKLDIQLEESYPFTNQMGVVFLRKYRPGYFESTKNFNEEKVFNETFNWINRITADRLRRLKIDNPTRFCEACALLSNAFGQKRNDFLARDTNDEDLIERRKEIVVYATNELLYLCGV
jgi:hypothetical protein